MSVDEKRPLPEGWREVPLEDMAQVERGITFPASSKSKEPFEGGIVCLRTSNVQEFVDWDDLIYVPKTYVKKNEKILREHDILISMANSYALVGKVSFVSGIPYKSSFGGFIAAIRTNSLVEPKYLFYHLRTNDTQDAMRRNSSQTVNIANLSLRTLYPMLIRVAPLPEQQRIVAEIEKQFTRLDQAVASLKRAQANLQRYKASVLKAACEGNLVPQDPNDEPAEILLQRILAERRKQWQEQEWAKLTQKAQKKVAQERRKAHGRPAHLSDLEPEEWQDIPGAEYAPHLPKNDKWKEKYKEPEGVETAVLPELPEGWVVTNLDNILLEIQTGPFGSSLHKSDYIIDGIPVINPASIINGRIIPIEGMSIDEETRERLSRFILSSGDVIMGRRGEMGRSAAITDREDGWLCGTGSLVLRFAQPISQQFMVYLFGSQSAKAYLGNASVGTTMQNLNQKILLNMLVGLPPENEQKRIVDEVERRLSVIATNERAIAADLARAERLRQSILQQAFSGQLVPNVEPKDISELGA